MPHKGVTILEREAYLELNLASNADGGEYSSDVAGETARWIREHGVSVPAKRERTLRVARDCKIRMIEEIVGFRAESDLRAFGQFKGLLSHSLSSWFTRLALGLVSVLSINLVTYGSSVSKQESRR